MKIMKKLTMAAAAALMLAGTAAAQDYPSEPYEFILAKLAAAEGHFDEALTRIDKVLAKNPTDPILQFERANLLLDAGKFDRAEAELESVVATNPDFYDAQRALGRMQLDRAGNDRAKVEKALTHLQAAYRIDGNDLSSGMTVSQILLSLGRNEDAERVLANLVERAPDQRTINYAYAQVLTKTGKGDQARKYLERAVTLDPTFGPAILQLLDGYQKEGSWQKAADVLQPLVDEDPMNLELQRQQAYFLFRSGQAEKARNAFKALAAADPKDERAQFYLAESLNDLQQFGEAEVIYKKLLEKTPADPELLASYGLAQIGQRKWDAAATTFGAIVATTGAPDHLLVLARTQLAFVNLQKGNYDAAIQGASQVAFFRDKPNAQAINIAIDAFRRQKKYAEALAFLEPLVSRAKNDPFVNARYIEMLSRTGDKMKANTLAAAQVRAGTRYVVSTGEAFVQAGDYPAAISIIREGLKATPEDIDLQFQLGSTLERSGDRKAAEQVFTTILSQQPENANALNYLGYMWADANENLDRAQEMLTRAVAQDPRNGAYIDSLGWLYFRQGKLELAEKYLSDAVNLLPTDSTVHEHLGDVLARRGANDRALASYRTALTLDPTPENEQSIRTKIAAIGQRQTSQR